MIVLSSPSRLAVVCRPVLAGVFLVSAVFKFIEPESPAHVVRYLLPAGTASWLADGAVVVLVSWESALSIWLLVDPRRAPVCCTAVSLVAYSAVLIRLLLDPHPPTCGCTALAIAVQDGRAQAAFGILQNVFLLLLCIGAIRGSADSALTGLARPNTADRTRSPQSRAFTLTELLAAIVILALLVSLILPALAGSKLAARGASSLSGLSQCLTAVAAYANDYRGAYPYGATPGDPFGPVAFRGAIYPLKDACFHPHVWYWGTLVWPDYLDAPRASLVDPEAESTAARTVALPATFIRLRYFLTATTLAEPRFWVNPPMTFGPGWSTMFRGLATHDVLFPGRKGVLLETMFGTPSHRGPANAGYFVGVADGAARQLPVANVLSAGFTAPPIVPIGTPILTTPRGLHGIDF